MPADRKWASRWNRHHAGHEAGFFGSDGYRRISLEDVHYLAHRIAWLLMTGVWPSEEIDHINRNRADNRFENLREATQLQNTLNTPRQSNNQSGYKGVTFHKYTKVPRWRAHITVNGRQKYLGLFPNPEAAAAAYRAASVQHHGVFGCAD